MNERKGLPLFRTDWQILGRKEGIIDMSLRQLQRKLGVVPPSIEERIGKLDILQLEKLPEDLLDFTNMSQLEAWLQQQELENAAKKN